MTSDTEEEAAGTSRRAVQLAYERARAEVTGSRELLEASKEEVGVPLMQLMVKEKAGDSSRAANGLFRAHSANDLLHDDERKYQNPQYLLAGEKVIA
jgi:hypothetical protein